MTSANTSFRQKHILLLLQNFDNQGLPIDVFVNGYLRGHKAIGAKDRKAITEAVYGLIRWRGLLDHLSEGAPSWLKRWELLQNVDPLSYRDRSEIPPHIRSSFPRRLFQHLATHHGEQGAFDICVTSNTPAPITIRANLLKTTRDELAKQLSDRVPLRPCKLSDDGLNVQRRMQLGILPEFRAGMFEHQDEASQLVAALVKAEPGQQVLDYCSGSGGKALAIAARMQNKGQLFLHDIRKRAEMEAKVRLRRAGVQNAQFVLAGDGRLPGLKNRMDWVLVDSPCTGSGTWRRNPDMKWRFEMTMLTELVEKQRTIFAQALDYLAPGGHIVYATCSLFAEENREQIEHFISTHNLALVGDPFQSVPTIGGMDGFFGAVLTRK